MVCMGKLLRIKVQQNDTSISASVLQGVCTKITAEATTTSKVSTSSYLTQRPADQWLGLMHDIWQTKQIFTLLLTAVLQAPLLM